MTRTQITTGVAVALAIAVVGFFFIFNSLAGLFGGGATQTAAATPMQEQNPAQLVVQDETVGSGAVAEAGTMITVNYTGKLADGTVFDTTSGKTPYTFLLGRGKVIPGWDEGLQGMKVGGKRLLIVPPALGYGAQQIGSIPPNSTLIFEVDLIAVTPASEPPPTQQTAN